MDLDTVLIRDGEQETGVAEFDSENPLAQLRVKLFADGANKAQILHLYTNPTIRGFTTNPTLMRKAGIADYEAFAKEVLETVRDRPVSLEVLSDEFPEIERQARKLASWGSNVYVKIPVTNTRGEGAYGVVQHLTREGIKVNVTAVLTLDQVRCSVQALANGTLSQISIFAGRIADTAVDPVPVMVAALELLRPHRQMELIWASPRELLNIFQADAIGCHIITATSDILNKLSLVGRDLGDYSLETVKMFYDDARQSGFHL